MLPFAKVAQAGAPSSGETAELWGRYRPTEQLLVNTHDPRRRKPHKEPQTVYYVLSADVVTHETIVDHIAWLTTNS